MVEHSVIFLQLILKLWQFRGFVALTRLNRARSQSDVALWCLEGNGEPDLRFPLTVSQGLKQAQKESAPRKKSHHK